MKKIFLLTLIAGINAHANANNLDKDISNQQKQIIQLEKEIGTMSNQNKDTLEIRCKKRIVERELISNIKNINEKDINEKKYNEQGIKRITERTKIRFDIEDQMQEEDKKLNVNKPENIEIKRTIISVLNKNQSERWDPNERLMTEDEVCKFNDWIKNQKK